MALRHTERVMAYGRTSSRAGAPAATHAGHGRDTRHDHAAPPAAATLRDPPEAPATGQPGAPRARRGAWARHAEPDRGRDHALLRLDDVRLPACHLVRLLDRIRGRELPLRPPDD